MKLRGAPKAGDLTRNLRRCADCPAVLSPLARFRRCRNCRQRSQRRPAPLRTCERCGDQVRSRAHNFRYCGACRADATREASLAWKHRTRGVPQAPPRPRECPDYQSPGDHDFAELDDLLICRYCSQTQPAA